ncbi:MAG: CNNM domain-containing protein [Planctomycetaceae bacterium]
MATLQDWGQFFAVTLLFLFGLRLSAFFSGTETGFYRLSLPRIGIDAQSGDRRAGRLLWFAQRPSYFVATTLVGNNIANYIITITTSLATVMVFGHGAEWAEIAATLAITPVIFLFGELLPKNVYYRAPFKRMRREIPLFYGFYLLVLPFTFPLVLLTKAIERLSKQGGRIPEMLPGRGRFQQMITHGHCEGVLTQAQSRLATNVLRFATERVSESMTPAHRVLGISNRSDARTILEFARKFGTSAVILFDEQAGQSADARNWDSYVRVGELATIQSALVPSVRRKMPTIPATATKLEALAILHEHSTVFGVVVDAAGKVLGTISQRGLGEQLRLPSVGRGVASPSRAND